MAEADLNDWTSQELRAAPRISLMLRAVHPARCFGDRPQGPAVPRPAPGRPAGPGTGDRRAPSDRTDV